MNKKQCVEVRRITQKSAIIDFIGRYWLFVFNINDSFPLSVFCICVFNRFSIKFS